jgi:hypothetical protein
MGMRHITGTAYGLVMRQGIARGLAGTRSRGTKVASAPLIGEEDDGPERSPTAGGKPADLNSGKGPGVNGPAKGTVLTCDMAQPAHVRRKQAEIAHLRLVWSA